VVSDIWLRHPLLWGELHDPTAFRKDHEPPVPSQEVGSSEET